MPGAALGIDVNVNAAGAIQSAKALERGLQGVRNAAMGAGRATRRAGTDMHQGLMNAIQGLQFLQYNLQKVTVALGGFLVGALEVAKDVELGFARIAIVMGKTGIREESQALIEEFDLIKAKVIEVGMATEFTMQEAASAFVNLKQAGLSARDAVDLLPGVMAFSSASAGTVDLARSADTATNAMAALGVSAEEMYKKGGYLDQMVRATNESKLSLHEMNIVMKSMGAASSVFTQTDPSAFIAIAMTLRTMGRSAAQSASDIQGMSRSMQQLGKVFLGVKMRGAARKKEGMRILGFTKEDFVDAQGNFRTLDDILVEGGKKVRASMAQNGEMATATALRMVFGTQEAINAFLLSIKAQDKFGKGIRENMRLVKEAYGDAEDAQKKYLETTEGMLKRLSGVWDGFRVSLVGSLLEMLKPVLRGLTDVLESITEWMAANPELASGISVVLASVTAFTGALSGLLGVMVALGFASLALNSKFLAMIMSLNFGKVLSDLFVFALAPIKMIIIPLLPWIAALAASVGALALAWKNDLGGLRTWATAWFDDISAAFSGVRDVISGKGIDPTTWYKMSDRAQELSIWLFVAYKRAQAMWRGFKSTFIPIMSGFGWVLAWVVKGLVEFAALIAWAFGDSYKMQATTEDWKIETEALGSALAIMGSILLGVAFVSSVAKIAMWALAGATKAATGIMLAFAKVRAALLAGFLTNPITLWVGAILLAVAALAALIYYGDDIDAWFKKISGGFVDFFDVALVALTAVGTYVFGPFALAIGGVAIAFKKLFELGVNEWLHEITGGWFNLFDAMMVVGGLLIGGPIGAGIAFLLAQFARLIIYLSGDGWETVKTAVVGALTAIGQFIWNFGSVIYNGGVNLITNLIEGMKDSWDHVKTGLNLIVNDIKGFFEWSPAKHGPLKTHSMTDAGSNLVTHLSQGLDDARPTLLESMWAITAPFTGITDVTNQVNAEGGGYDAPLLPAVDAPRAPTQIANEREPQVSKRVEIGSISLNVEIKLDAKSVDETVAKRLAKMVADQLGEAIEDELGARLLA